MKTNVLRLSILVGVVMLGIRAFAAAPQLRLDAQGGYARGLTPGGESVWFVVSVGEASGMPRRARTITVLKDDDGDGQVSRLAPPGHSSVWVVVDYTTGEYSVASPEGVPPVELGSKGNGWGPGAEAQDFDVLKADSLLVRAGVGAWAGYSDADGRGDADPRADNVRIRLADMVRIHGTQANTPPVALPRDVLVVVDRVTLRTFVRAAKGNGQ